MNIHIRALVILLHTLIGGNSPEKEQITFGSADFTLLLNQQSVNLTDNSQFKRLKTSKIKKTVFKMTQCVLW